MMLNRAYLSYLESVSSEVFEGKFENVLMFKPIRWKNEM